MNGEQCVFEAGELLIAKAKDTGESKTVSYLYLANYLQLFSQLPVVIQLDNNAGELLIAKPKNNGESISVSYLYLANYQQLFSQLYKAIPHIKLT